jgi:hypothetical protein
MEWRASNPVKKREFQRFSRQRLSQDARIERHVQPVPGGREILWCASIVLAGLIVAVATRGAETPPAPRLQTETANAFSHYVELTEARNTEELRASAPEFWVDRLNEKEREAAYEALKRGEVKMQRLDTRDGGKKIECPHGMIHHWAGLVFIPGAKLDDVLGVLKDYDHHEKYYAPDVERSRTESHDGDHFRVMLRFRRHKVITVVLNTEHEVRYFRDSAARAHSRSSAVRISQVENSGRDIEREKPEGDDDGFLWKMETWWRMEERDGGVYVQSEVASLTRDIPTGLGWLIGPFVTSVPRETLAFTLEATRRGVEARRQSGRE